MPVRPIPLDDQPAAAVHRVDRTRPTVNNRRFVRVDIQMFREGTGKWYLLAAAQPLGGRVTVCGEFTNAWRILTRDGQPSDRFRWDDPARLETVREVLEREGVRFDEQAVPTPPSGRPGSRERQGYCRRTCPIRPPQWSRAPCSTARNGSHRESRYQIRDRERSDSCHDCPHHPLALEALTFGDGQPFHSGQRLDRCLVDAVPDRDRNCPWNQDIAGDVS